MIKIKTMTFAAVHFSVAFGVAYAFTGSLLVGGLIALVEPTINTVAYYFHEKAWTVFRGERSLRSKIRDAWSQLMRSDLMADYALAKG
jgi:uncharacterized membrane protein